MPTVDASLEPYRGIARCSLLLAVLACAACQHVPPAPIDPMANARKLSDRSLHDPIVDSALQRYGQPVRDENWSLDQLTVAAWVLRPDIAVVLSEIDAARAVTRVEGQMPNPTLSLGSERVISASHGINPWVLASSVSLLLETAGKRDLRRQRALATEQETQWQLGELLWSARAEVRTALIDRALAELSVALDDREAMLWSDYLGWIETRIRFGAATAQDRFLPSQSLAEAEIRRDLDKAKLASVTAKLAATIGVSADALAAITLELPAIDDLPEIAAGNIADARDQAIANRVDIRRALAEYEVTEQDLRAAVARQYPDIGFGPGYSFDREDHKITLTLDLPVPLFHGSAAVIGSALAERRTAAARFDAVQSKVLAEIDMNFARYRAVQEALAAGMSAENAAQRMFEATRQRTQAGVADRGDLLTAELDLVTRRRHTIEARRAVIDAISGLENGIERPLFPSSSLDSVGATAGSLSEPSL